MAGFYDVYRMMLGWWSSETTVTPGIPSEWITLESDFSPIVAMNNDRHSMATEAIDVNYLTSNDTHTIDTSNNQIILNMRTN